MNFQIIKRDGSLEEYNETKIARVVTAAGLSPVQAKLLAADITAWLQKSSQLKFSSLKLRDKVIEELRKISKEAHDLYAWYQKTID